MGGGGGGGGREDSSVTERVGLTVGLGFAYGCEIQGWFRDIHVYNILYETSVFRRKFAVFE